MFGAHVLAVTVALLVPAPVLAGEFLGDEYASTFHAEIRKAADVALGCGEPVGQGRLADIKDAILPIWVALPKNLYGNVEQGSLRYLAQRYSMKTSGIAIRGFERTAPPIADSQWASAQILSQQVPAFVESVLESKHAVTHGFSFEDAVTMALMLEQLLRESSITLLDRAYVERRLDVQQTLSRRDLHRVLETYMLDLLLNGLDNQEFIAQVKRDHTLRIRALTDWPSVEHLFLGLVRAVDRKRYRAPLAVRDGAELLEARYSFADALAIVSTATSGIHTIMDIECTEMARSLVALDPLKTGRVPLAKFYHSGVEGFSESEGYLRELGALDETSRWVGQQVLIANYLVSGSNAIVTMDHYYVVCPNECNAIMAEVEMELGSPVASPTRILEVIGNMTRDDDDLELVDIVDALVKQLVQVGEARGGLVPIHGRLFAQWLHYMFPHSCPFPHKIGVAKATPPHEYTSSIFVTPDELQKHAPSAGVDMKAAAREDLEWMSQWDHEEELVADYSFFQERPWHSGSLIRGVLFLAIAVIAALSVLSGIGIGHASSGGSVSDEKTLHVV